MFIEVALLEQSSAEADNYHVRLIVVCKRVLGLTLSCARWVFPKLFCSRTRSGFIK